MTHTELHAVKGNKIKPPFNKNLSQIMFGLGCFWGAEKVFWQMDGVFTTAVGYSAGSMVNPSYQQVCTGETGHNEVVLVVYDANKIHFTKLLETFWQAHNPTEGMAQGNDKGTQYRSGIYYFNQQQKQQANNSQQQYQQALNKKGLGQITTEIIPATTFYYAESYHQQYLAKNPNGYCGLGGTGVRLSLSLFSE